MLNGGYTFEKYSATILYKEVDDTQAGLVANEAARALCARSQGSGKPECRCVAVNKRMMAQIPVDSRINPIGMKGYSMMKPAYCTAICIIKLLQIVQCCRDTVLCGSIRYVAYL